MCLRDQGIDDNDGGIGRVRRVCRLSDNNRGVGRGRGIYDASEGSETTMEAEKAGLPARGTYNNNGGVGIGR